MIFVLMAVICSCAGIILYILLGSALDDSPKRIVRARLEELAEDVELESLHNEVLLEQKKKKAKKENRLISKRLQDSLAMSGVKLSAQEYLTLWIAASLGPVVFGLLLGMQPVAVLGMSIIGLALPPVMVKRSRDKQRQLFNRQLGEALTIMSNCMRSGYSFQQALTSIAREMQPPVSVEFARVVREMNYGVSMEDALDHMVRRVENKDLELLVSAVLTSMEVGANLSEILDTIAETVRDRIRLREEVQVLSAQGRFSGMVIGLLPVVVVLLLMVINPTYFASFTETDTGRLMVLVSVCMELCGFYVISRVVDIKY